MDEFTPRTREEMADLYRRHNYYFSNPDRDRDWPYLVTQDGTFVTDALSYSGWGNLTDEDPTDNRVSISLVVGLDEDALNGVEPFASNIRGLRFPAADLVLNPVAED